MSDEQGMPLPDAESERLRLLALIGCGAQVLFWLFFAFDISAHTNRLGDGMEWLAFLPATLILFGLVIPALLTSLIASGRGLAVAVGVMSAGAVFNVLLFMQIAREFAHKGGL